eukprot:CAMPEP_0197449996 /NCGR_PEP_ID=MMETSP1175-20131217/23625_1 /TAXON_ID=1003142 /ORGANISM="Triceratium dubium, Strain CCMP147" /LENGTH=91 /DNA_ID=CAMNT_0042982299 /DNA_START=295 /DNA_END=567 /DNA_ORIENTATION=-
MIMIRRPSGAKNSVSFVSSNVDFPSCLDSLGLLDDDGGMASFAWLATFASVSEAEASRWMSIVRLTRFGIPLGDAGQGTVVCCVINDGIIC